MTTALIGTQGTLAGKARVAWVSQRAGEQLASLVQRAGHELIECPDWAALQQATGNHPFDLVFCDEEVASEQPTGLGSQVVVIGDRNVGHDGPAIPFAALESSIGLVLSLALESGRATERVRELERLTGGIRSGQALAGNSPIVRRLHGTLSRAADCDATVLIEGPVGSGKSLAARIIHCKSRRGGQPLVAVDCAGVTVESLVKTLETARTTTLILEDIDRLPANTQAQLVRFLKDRTAGTAAATRLVVTTSAHLPELVARGAFREDLYYRLHAFPIVVPALRERVEDAMLIAHAVLEAGLQSTGRPTPGFTPAAQMLIESMPWPGNIAQLEAAVRRAQVLAGGAAIDRDHLLVAPSAAPKAIPGVVTPAATTATQSAGEEIDEDAIRPFEEEEQMLLTRALRATKGNVRRAAQLLGIGRATLYRKIQQYHLRLQ